MSFTVWKPTRICTNCYFGSPRRSTSFAGVRKTRVFTRLSPYRPNSVLDSTEEQSSRDELGTTYFKWIELFKSTTEQVRCPDLNLFDILIAMEWVNGACEDP